MAQLHISKLVSLIKSVVSSSNLVTPEELITLYNRDINWCLLPTQLKLAQWLLPKANSQTTCVKKYIAWFKGMLKPLPILIYSFFPGDFSGI